MGNFRIFLFSQLYSLTPYFLYRQLYFVFLNVFSLDHMHHTEFGVHDKNSLLIFPISRFDGGRKK